MEEYMSNGLLEVRGLMVRVEDKEILHGIDLEIQKGETHVLMGPNGAGKSTLGYRMSCSRESGSMRRARTSGPGTGCFCPFRTHWRFQG